MDIKTNDPTGLAGKSCKPCKGGTPALDEAAARDLLKQLKDWNLEKGALVKTFEFANYYETTAFVNAVAWIAHREDHHPDIAFGYKKCRVSFVTHAANGLTENDFIAAAKVDRLLVS